MSRIITREEIGDEEFDLILEDYCDEIEKESRRGSNYYCRKVYEIDDTCNTGDTSLNGFWITDTHIDDNEYSMSDCGTEINKLTKVRKVKVIKESEEWRED